MTIAELALHSTLSIEEARKVLDELTTSDIAQLHFTDDGEPVYVFTGLVADKDAAYDPLDHSEVELDLAEEDAEVAASVHQAESK